MSLPIADYGLIGDTHTAALVGTTGSIDWLCLPRFDAPACFAALLGEDSHGRWLLAPAGDVRRVARRYVGPTLVLETEFETGAGVVRVTDCMPIRKDAPDLVRIVEGVRGHVEMQMDLVVRFDYGSIVPWVRRREGVWTAVGGPDALAFWSPVETFGADLTTKATFSVREGQTLPFRLVWYPSHRPTPRPADPVAAVADTRRWWEDWCGRCTYDGRYRDDVLRSLIVLKALTYAPTGGIVAAPTTSLPEQIGGVRNWDYRYCWIRDATLTLNALMVGGYTTEAVAWRNWLLRAVAGEPSRLQVLYGPAGERRLPELELDWLPGYAGSRPVRVGNAAVRQRQLDIYGEVMDVLDAAREIGVHADAPTWSLQQALLAFIEKSWREADHGIWEVRGPMRHFTHSKVMAWVAMDRAVRAVERFHHAGPVDRWRAERQAIHDDVCRNGFNRRVGAFTMFYGSDELDASLLMIPLVGFLPATDPRVAGTVAAIERELRAGPIVRRYRADEKIRAVDGLPPGEGAFLPCSFWLADTYALQGRTADAERLFERLLGMRNEVGLLAEAWDPVNDRLVGNFPQAFTHVGLINAAHHLSGPTSRAPR